MACVERWPARRRSTVFVERSELIRMFVLDVIADDYENLDKIYGEVGQLAKKCGLAATAREIRQGLLDLIRTNLAKAYRLSPRRPTEEISGVPSPDEIEECYFWVTDGGRQLQSSDYADWPFDETGSLRTDWSPPTG